MVRLPNEQEENRYTPNGTWFDPDCLRVEVGRADYYGNQKVVTELYGNVVEDCFDRSNGYRRQKYREKCWTRFDLEPSSESQFHEALEEAINAKSQESDAAAARPLEKFTFTELKKLHPRLNEPVIDGLIRRAETCNVVSASKAGKSWLAIYILLSIIVGRQVFGRFSTAIGKCLLIDNELHKPTIAHRIEAVARAMGLSAEDYENNLDVIALRGNLRTMADLAAELEQIEPATYRAILLDAKYRFLPAGVSENDNASETQQYNLLDRIAEQQQAALLLIHHESKGDQSSKRLTDIGAGAGAQSRAADCHLVLREHEQPGVVVLEAVTRSFPPVEPLPLRWSFPLWLPADDADATKLRGKQTRNEERQSEADRAGVNAIVDAIRKDGPGDRPAVAEAYRAEP